MEDIIVYFAKLYEQILANRRNEDYEVNPVQMERFLAILRFFRGKVDPEFDEGFEPFHLEAKEECGGFSADFCVFDLYGTEIQEFARLISYCSALSIDARTESQICISLTVPNIFIRRAEADPEEDPGGPDFWNIWDDSGEGEE